MNTKTKYLIAFLAIMIINTLVIMKLSSTSQTSRQMQDVENYRTACLMVYCKDQDALTNHCVEDCMVERYLRDREKEIYLKKKLNDGLTSQ